MRPATWPSSCSNHGTELFFTNDQGTYFLDMWRLFPEPGELATLSGFLARLPAAGDDGVECTGEDVD